MRKKLFCCKSLPFLCATSRAQINCRLPLQPHFHLLRCHSANFGLLATAYVLLIIECMLQEQLRANTYMKSLNHNAIITSRKSNFQGLLTAITTARQPLIFSLPSSSSMPHDPPAACNALNLDVKFIVPHTFHFPSYPHIQYALAGALTRKFIIRPIVRRTPFYMYIPVIYMHLRQL